MLKHEFITIERSEIPLDINYSITKKYCYVALPDEIIFHYMNDFTKGFISHWNNLGSTNEGLNYYGVTIILNEEIDQFINVLLKHKKWVSVKKLIRTCKAAQKGNLDIIHIGI